jgi:hypothetical protein
MLTYADVCGTRRRLASGSGWAGRDGGRGEGTWHQFETGAKYPLIAYFRGSGEGGGAEA